MDAISLMVLAMSTGAAAALKPTAESAIKDAYSGLKSLLRAKFQSVSVENLEANPASRARQAVLAEELAATSAAHDLEIVGAAKELLLLVRQFAPDIAGAVGVNLEDISADTLKIDDVSATGGGVVMKRADIARSVRISNIRAGKSEAESTEGL